MRKVDNAYVWRSGLAVDADGSPHAYHPDSAPGLDYLANAGKPGKWWALACGPDGLPWIQSDEPDHNGYRPPAPGFFISTTSLVDPAYPAWDPRRYVDSETVPYITHTREMVGVKPGDLAIVAYAGKVCSAVVADFGPHPGEGSIALAKALGIPADPRHGGLTAPAVSFVVFSGSSLGWPVGLERIDAEARRLFDVWGGLDRLATSLTPT